MHKIRFCPCKSVDLSFRGSGVATPRVKTTLVCLFSNFPRHTIVTRKNGFSGEDVRRVAWVNWRSIFTHEKRIESRVHYADQTSCIFLFCTLCNNKVGFYLRVAAKTDECRYPSSLYLPVQICPDCILYIKSSTRD